MNLIHHFLEIANQVHKFNEVVDSIINGIHVSKPVKSCNCMICHVQVGEFVVPKSELYSHFLQTLLTIITIRRISCKMDEYFVTLIIFFIHNNFVRDVTQFTNGLIFSQI